MRRNFLIYLSLILSAYSSVLFANPTSEELWEHVLFVHITDYLVDGTVTPGMSMKPPAFFKLVPKDQFQNAKNRMPFESFIRKGDKAGTEDLWVINTKDRFPDPRFTSHWSINESTRNTTEPFSATKTAPAKPSTWDQAIIAIIEPAKHFKKQLYGGYHADMIVIGPHKLSADAIILVPKGQVEAFTKSNPSIDDSRILRYDPMKTPNARAALKKFNKALRGKYFPDHWNLMWPSDPEGLKEVDLQGAVKEFAVSIAADPKLNKLFNSILPSLDMFDVKPTITSSEKQGFKNAIQLFLKSAQMNPETGIIKRGKDYIPAKKLFRAWQVNDRLFWGFHASTPFRQLEIASSALFDPYIKWLIYRDVSNVLENPSIREEADMLFRGDSPSHVLLRQAQILHEAARNLREATKRLGETEIIYLNQRLENLDLWLFAFGGFANIHENPIFRRSL